MLPGDATPTTEDHSGATLFRVVSDLRRVLRRTILRGLPFAPLSPSQGELLHLVDSQPGIGVREAAETLRLAPNTISTLVGGLTEAGLLARDRDRHDARAVRLRVTGKARQRIDAWSHCSAQVLDRALVDMDPDDRRHIIKALPALKRLAQSLERNATAGPDRLDRSPRA
jgi:DNA-binding MarR family transcriptional regulator